MPEEAPVISAVPFGLGFMFVSFSLELAQRFERRSDLGSEEFRLFERREVTALVDLVPINELVKILFGPASRRAVYLAGKDRHGNRDRWDVHGIDWTHPPHLPVGPRGRRPGVCEPVQRDVVEHLISRERPLGLAAAIGPGGELVIEKSSQA